MHDSNGLHTAILILLIFTAVNLLILDIKVFTPSIPAVRLSDIAVTASPNTPNPPYSPNPSYPLSQEAVARIVEEKLAQLTTSPPQSLLQEDLLQIASQQPARESYIPLGSGSTDKSDWQNMIATETFIDPANYGTIKSAQLIVGLRNPTANGAVEARLFNVTDGYVVYGSHVTLQGKTEQTITAGPFEFPKGPKLYRMQLKSTLSYQAYLDNARLKIITQ